MQCLLFKLRFYLVQLLQACSLCSICTDKPSVDRPRVGPAPFFIERLRTLEVDLVATDFMGEALQMQLLPNHVKVPPRSTEQ